jgi:hypothetical protein
VVRCVMLCCVVLCCVVLCCGEAWCGEWSQLHAKQGTPLCLILARTLRSVFRSIKTANYDGLLDEWILVPMDSGG